MGGPARGGTVSSGTARFCRFSAAHLDARHPAFGDANPMHALAFDGAHVYDLGTPASGQVFLVDGKSHDASDRREAVHVERGEVRKGVKGQDALWSSANGQFLPSLALLSETMRT